MKKYFFSLCFLTTCVVHSGNVLSVGQQGNNGYKKEDAVENKGNTNGEIPADAKPDGVGGWKVNGEGDGENKQSFIFVTDNTEQKKEIFEK